MNYFKICSQNITNYPHFNAFKNIALPLQIIGCSGDEIRCRVFEVAKKLKIDKFLSFKPKQLSVGQNQRVNIARTLVKKPSVYLFDEMFSNIDLETKNELLLDLRSMFKEINKTVVFVTHDPHEAMLLADQLVILKNGEFIFDDIPSKVFYSSNQDVKELFEDYYEKN